MPPEQIINAVATVGFPIVACCAMFYLYDKTMNRVILTLQELTDVMKAVKCGKCEIKAREGAE